MVWLCIFSASASRLSPSAQVSLITCAPGDDFYEVFGHTAIRIKDPERNMDVAYNYGVFDFDRPDFYPNFAKGHLVYMMGVDDFSAFFGYYASVNRAVTEQVLDLTSEQIQTLYDTLETNYLPKNRDYVYDYFYDNCATRPRDIIQFSTGNNIVFDYTYAGNTHYTIRQLVNQFADKDTWGDLGIDLALGSATDKTMTPFQYMYLPDYLMKAFDVAKIKNGNEVKPLVKQKHMLSVAKPALPASTDWTSPLHVFWIFFVFVVLYTTLYFIKGKPGYWFDALLFLVAGTVGCILVYISLFTNHHSGQNFNLLWLFPLHVIAGILLQFKRMRSMVRYYFAASAMLLLITLCLWKVLPQGMNYTVIPLILALLLRCVNVIYFERK